MRDSNQCDIRIICDKAKSSDIRSALIEGMKRQRYKLLKCSNPRASRKDPNDVLVYLEFMQE